MSLGRGGGVGAFSRRGFNTAEVMLMSAIGMNRSVLEGAGWIEGTGWGDDEDCCSADVPLVAVAILITCDRWGCRSPIAKVRLMV